jgi:hypothetical protein
MARYVRIRLANGDIRHVTLPQNETHTHWTLVAKASIVEVSLVELDEQPALDGVLPAKTPTGEARARARIFE